MALLEAKANVNARDKNGRTPLIVAAQRRNNSRMMRTLLEAGADPKAKDKSGQRAVDYVRERDLGSDLYQQLQGSSK
jgi:ankyrin repeat protein